MSGKAIEIVLTKEADAFIRCLPEAAARKVRLNILRVQLGERSKELFKKLEGSNIWEFRTLYNRTVYRLFAFWDKDKQTIIVTTHGIIKKSQKTPHGEIAKAEKIRQNYFQQKQI